MRYFGSFESYALFLYKSKTSVTQIVPPQPNYPTKITLARVACLWLSLVTQRGLSPAEERGRCVTRLHIDREGDYCVCETNTA